MSAHQTSLQLPLRTMLGSSQSLIGYCQQFSLCESIGTALKARRGWHQGETPTVGTEAGEGLYTDLAHELRTTVHAPEEGVHAAQVLQLVLLDQGDEAAVLHLC